MKNLLSSRSPTRKQTTQQKISTGIQGPVGTTPQTEQIEVPVETLTKEEIQAELELKKEINNLAVEAGLKSGLPEFKYSELGHAFFQMERATDHEKLGKALGKSPGD